MGSPPFFRTFRGTLLSASSLTLLMASAAPTLAQGPTSPAAPGTTSTSQPIATPQPSASPAAQPSPQPESSATPAPSESPANSPTPQSTPAVEAAPPGTNVLPETRVAAPVERRRPRAPPPRQIVRNPPSTAPAAPSAEQAQTAANRQVVQQTQNFDQRRDNVILPKTGTTNYNLTQRDIESLPQGNAATLKDVVLQFPGVYQDSTSSGDFHVRNEHANVQYRINGVLLPDGVSGFSQLLETPSSAA